MSTRRDFLVAAGWLGIGVAGAQALPPRSVEAAATRPLRTIYLETREVMWELAPGKTIKAMVCNGEVPGPIIRAREGDRLQIVVKNSLSEPTTVHLHGVDVPNAMDGVPGLTQPPIQPAETFTYEFEAQPAGTRWYQTHFDEHRQMDLGLTAPLIIESTGAEPLSYDREMTLVLDDWATGTGTPVPDTDAGTAGGRGRAGGMMGGMVRGGGGKGGMMGGRGMGGMMGGRGMGGMMRDAGKRVYDVMTINGKAHPGVTPLRFKKGERVRLRIINASAEHTHVVRLAGHKLAATHSDGNSLAAPVDVAALPPRAGGAL